MPVGPVQVPVDEARRTVVGTELAGENRNHLRYLADGAVPACLVVALAEVVDVGAGAELACWVGRSVGQPVRQVASPTQPSGEYGLACAGGSNRVEQSLHSRRPPALGGGAAVSPALPADIVRFVVKVEDHARVADEAGGHRGPESGSVIGVCHHLLAGGLLGTGSVPVQVQHDGQAGGMQPLDEAGDGVLVRLATVLRGNAVDAEPAALVQGQPDGVDAPRGHRCDRGVVGRPVEQPPSLRAGELTTGAVDSTQAQRPARRVDQGAADDAHRNRRARGSHCPWLKRYDRGGGRHKSGSAPQRRGHSRHPSKGPALEDHMTQVGTAAGRSVLPLGWQAFLRAALVAACDGTGSKK